MALEPIFEVEFHDSSYGFRPNRSTHHAVLRCQQMLQKRFTWIIEGDVKACFDEISHEAILGCLREKVMDNRFLALIHRLVLRLLPRHFFVYVFINGFFAAALTVFGVGLAATLLLGIARAYEWEYLATEYLPYFILLGFSEAWLSGMLVTLFAVYRPDWIVTFDDSSYLTNK